MRRIIDSQVMEMIKLTKENPGKLTLAGLARELDISRSSVRLYSKQLGLPVKSKRPPYPQEQIDFVKANAATITNAEVSKKLGIKPYQAQDIAKKAGVKFFVKTRPKVESEFFEHDQYYSRIW